jgi:hypothetical protein
MSSDKLVTCIVRRHKESWEVIWISDTQTPRDFKAGGLSETIDRATREISAIYAGTLASAETELQFAIYPFSDRASIILDLNRNLDGFTALDLDAKGVTLRAQTLESLVEQASQSRANHEDVMFRWVMPMSQLALG